MSDTSLHLENRTLTAFAVVIETVLLFALGEVLTKYLTTRYPVELIMVIRFAVSSILIMALVWPKIGRNLWKINRTR